MKITIRTKPLAAVYPFASTEKTRYYLNGVFIQNDVLVATDGRKLAIVKPDMVEGEIEDFILPSETIKRILSVKPCFKTVPLSVTFDSELKQATVFHAATDEDIVLAIFPYKPVDGTFPEWKKVFPNEDDFFYKNRKEDSKNKNATTFNSKILSSFSSLGESLTVFLNNTPEYPSVIVGGVVDSFQAIGAIMPRRGGNTENFPKWLTEIMGETK